MSRRSEAIRGGQFVAKGGDVIADLIDRRRIDTETKMDWCGHEGACRLARRIEEFWGGSVRCWVERMPVERDAPPGLNSYYVVRSSLSFSFPPRPTA